MKKKLLLAAAATLAVASVAFLSPRVLAAATGKTWAIEADYIEACSCHLFCSCYFNTSPDGGHACEFNNAVKVASGHVGDVKVDGVKFWMSGDLGGDFSTGEMKSAVVTFDSAVTKEQQEALKYLIAKLYPVKWGKMQVDTAPITWEMNGMDAHAKVGDKGSVDLVGVKDSHGKQSVVSNTNYWGAQKNDGFHLAKGTHAYKGFGHDYTFKDRNGFTIHVASEGTVE